MHEASPQLGMLTDGVRRRLQRRPDDLLEEGVDGVVVEAVFVSSTRWVRSASRYMRAADPGPSPFMPTSSPRAFARATPMPHCGPAAPPG